MKKKSIVFQVYRFLYFFLAFKIIKESSFQATQNEFSINTKKKEWQHLENQRRNCWLRSVVVHFCRVI